MTAYQINYSIYGSNIDLATASSISDNIKSNWKSFKSFYPKNKTNQLTRVEESITWYEDENLTIPVIRETYEDMYKDNVFFGIKTTTTFLFAPFINTEDKPESIEVTKIYSRYMSDGSLDNTNVLFLLKNRRQNIVSFLISQSKADPTIEPYFNAFFNYLKSYYIDWIETGDNTPLLTAIDNATDFQYLLNTPVKSELFSNVKEYLTTYLKQFSP